MATAFERRQLGTDIGERGCRPFGVETSDGAGALTLLEQ